MAKTNELSNAEMLLAGIQNAVSQMLTVRTNDRILLNGSRDARTATAVLAVLASRAAQDVETVKADLTALGVNVNA